MMLSELQPGDRLEVNRIIRGGTDNGSRNTVMRSVCRVVQSTDRFVTVQHRNYRDTVSYGEICAGQVRIRLLKESEAV